MKVQIFYATSTGNSKHLANVLKKKLIASGALTEVSDFSESSPEALSSLEQAVFIVSTWGDGEPPDDALDAWDLLSSSNCDLSGMSYCVFGLGDSEYPEFNAFGRMLDERLNVLGARRMHAFVAADLDYDSAFTRWAGELCQSIVESCDLRNTKC